MPSFPFLLALSHTVRYALYRHLAFTISTLPHAAQIADMACVVPHLGAMLYSGIAWLEALRADGIALYGHVNP
jgi:hypothetical protein